MVRRGIGARGSAGLALEDFGTLGQRHPGLFAARPDMPGRVQPGRVVKGAAAHPHLAAARRAAYPRAAFRADQPDRHAPAIGGARQLPRLDPGQAEPGLGHDDAQRERAARQTLAVETVACIDRARFLGDLVAQFSALAPAGLRQPCHRPVLFPYRCRRQFRHIARLVSIRRKSLAGDPKKPAVDM